MKKFVLWILAAPAIAASVFGIFVFYWYGRQILQPCIDSGIYFSSKQVSLLADIAKALIPTVTGFAVLVMSGVGFLQKKNHMRLFTTRAGVLGVIIALVLSLACWTTVLVTMVDCARPFDRVANEALTLGPNSYDLRFLRQSWLVGVLATNVGIIAFFVAVNIAVLVGAAILDTTQKTPAQIRKGKAGGVVSPNFKKGNELKS